MQSVFCTLSNDPEFSVIYVKVEPTAFVADLRAAICAQETTRLGKCPPSKLVLVRIAKAEAGGLEMSDLKQAEELLNQEAYGEVPEAAADTVSEYAPLPGAVRVKGNLLFKVMHPMKKVKDYFKSAPEELYHVLVVVPADEQAPSADDKFDRLQQSIAAMPQAVTRLIQEHQEALMSFSNASSTFKNTLFEQLDVVARSIRIPALKKLVIGPYKNFKWHVSKEDSAINKTAYMAHVTALFGGFDDIEIINGDEVLLESIELRLHGHADILMASSHSAGTGAEDCHLLFELKKDTSTSKKLVQAQLQVLCADYRSSYPVLGVVSDLNGYWQLIWIERQPERALMRVSQPLSEFLAIGVIQWYLTAVQNMMNRGGDILMESDYPDGGAGGDNSWDDSNSSGKANMTEFKLSIAKLRQKPTENAQGAMDMDGDCLDMDRDDFYQAAITSFVRQHAVQLTELASAVKTK
ncbi:hypothetical protein HDU81_000331 [Chytriomyces hyalinus]|nr:hypothetical protein HDU81_000331 [Chytriomyces hyalinus]